ncbi:UDP-N-acetylbacillosamine N-acetyltransferase [Burkholderiales bacterium]|nr:UDP-N-acetylbacillosamine N-acetyltransferase [Burkholderiales bacterium]
MSDVRQLVVIGEAPLATLAGAIGIMERGTGNVRVVELTPDRIATDPLDFLADHPADATHVFAAIGLSALNYARFDLWAKLRIKGYRCATLVHPRAHVDPSAVLADNVLVGPNASIEPDVHIGRGTIVGAATSIGTAAEIAPWCWFARGVVIGALASVGAHSVLGTGVQFADRTQFPGPGEIDVAGTYRGAILAGMFVSPEFPNPGARLVRTH